MRLWKLLKKRRAHRAAKEKYRRSISDMERTVSKLDAQVKDLRAQIRTVHLVLGIHDCQIAHCRKRIRNHGRALGKLEHIAGGHTVAGRAQNSATMLRSPQPGAPLQNTGDPIASGGKFDIDQFTEQEKRLLTVFFQNKGRRMSYADVARILNKSTYTVKNQLNHIRHKADLFEQSVGNQSRNLFKLKDDLRVEKYLHCGQSAVRPVSTYDGDHRDAEKVSVMPERTLP